MENTSAARIDRPIRSNNVIIIRFGTCLRFFRLKKEKGKTNLIGMD